jgi:hypothetical protein
MVAACGGGVVLFSVNSGVVLDDAVCRGGAGEFDLRNQGGLILVVIIASDTVILDSNGARGTCPDVQGGRQARVRGVTDGGRINAREVQLQ